MALYDSFQPHTLLLSSIVTPNISSQLFLVYVIVNNFLGFHNKRFFCVCVWTIRCHHPVNSEQKCDNYQLRIENEFYMILLLLELMQII